MCVESFRLRELINFNESSSKHRLWIPSDKNRENYFDNPTSELSKGIKIKTFIKIEEKHINLQIKTEQNKK